MSFKKGLGIDFGLFLNILDSAHDNVVVVILFFMPNNNCTIPESFFENWSGKPSNGVKPKFTNAEGTSLNSGQLRRLTESKVPVIRPKEADFLKVFVPGPNGSLKSVIIHRDELKDLADDLLPYGVRFSVRDQKTYGIE